MKRILKILVLIILVGLLVLIRLYEYQYFYDPFMHFFQNVFQDQEQYTFPPRMFFNVFLRFTLNSIISLAILFVVFKNVGIIKFSALVFAVFFLMFFPLFIYLMHNVSPDDYLAAFYVRRFLVHPVLVLLLLPAFYYFRLRVSAEERNVRDF